jgi:hypothetical protein
MPSNPSPSATLPCEQCGYLNEPERVYCHNCGSKLDRSLLPKGEEKKQEPPEKARKRISKMTNPQAGWFGREVKALFKVAIYAALLAAILLIIQKPDGLPDGKKEPTMRLVSSDMMEALESPTPRALSFTEDEVNQYLKQMLKKTEGAIPGVDFTRAYISFLPGVLHLCSEQAVLGYPLFSGIDYQVEIKDGKLATKIVGGNFGRLAVDPQIMQYLDVAFQNLWKALDRERKQMDKMQSVKIEKQRIDLVTKGTAGAR